MAPPAGIASGAPAEAADDRLHAWVAASGGNAHLIAVKIVTIARQALARGDDLAETLGCDDAPDVAACLRGLPVDAWRSTGEPLTTVATLARGWDGVVDGVIVPGPPRERVEDGLVAARRVLVGEPRPLSAW